LKAVYREVIDKDIADACKWILLEGSIGLIKERMSLRQGHFMPLELLESQFALLEVPEDAIRVSIVDNPERIIANIMDLLSP
jgi:gluconokinase